MASTRISLVRTPTSRSKSIIARPLPRALAQEAGTGLLSQPTIGSSSLVDTPYAHLRSSLGDAGSLIPSTN